MLQLALHQTAVIDLSKKPSLYTTLAVLTAAISAIILAEVQNLLRSLLELSGLLIESGEADKLYSK